MNAYRQMNMKEIFFKLKEKDNNFLFKKYNNLVLKEQGS